MIVLSDEELQDLAIPALVEYLIEWEIEDHFNSLDDETLAAEAAAEAWAEGAWLRAAEAGDYAGSLEEARDRYLDSLAGL